MGASISNTRGFTLVEISIVMIIIGLLIGGTFGGMKLVENMQVNKTVQDLKAIESAALTFKDTYGRLPGDMPNTAARLPNCTVAPCATGGNGNRTVGTAQLAWSAITTADENFTFWNHLQAADLLSLGVKNVADTTFSEGQPESSLNGGYRLSDITNNVGCVQFTKTFLMLTDLPDAVVTSPRGISCSALISMDRKLDDGMPYNGKLVVGWGCPITSAVCSPIPEYSNPGGATGMGVYDLRF